MITKKRVLITGGAGFLGSFLAERLARRNKVTILDDLSSGRRENLKACKCRFVKARLGSRRGLSLVRTGQFHYVVHLAANAYIKYSVDHPDRDFEKNLEEPFRFLETVRKMKNRPKILLASTAAVHGNNIRFPMREDDALHPVSPYGISKLAMEYYGEIYHKMFGVPSVSLRFYPMYGPRHYKQVIFDLMEKFASAKKRIKAFGTGQEIRDFTYVEDAAAAIEVVMQKFSFSGGVINLCSGKGVSIKRVANSVRREMGKKKEIDFTQKLRPGDVNKMIGFNGKLRQLGFRPEVSFQEGIKRSVEWFLAL